MIFILHKDEIGEGLEITQEGKLIVKAGNNVKVTDEGVNTELPDLSDIENRLTVVENNQLLDYAVPEGYYNVTESISKYNPLSKEILYQQVLKEFVKNESRTDNYSFKVKDVVLKRKSKEYLEELTNRYSSWIPSALYMHKFDLTYTLELNLPTKFVDELKLNIQDNTNVFLRIFKDLFELATGLSDLPNELRDYLNSYGRYQTLIGYETSNINVTSESSADISIVTVEVSVQDLAGIFHQDLGESREFAKSIDIALQNSILYKQETLEVARTPSEYPDVDKVDMLYLASSVDGIRNTADDTVNFTYLIQE